MDGAARWKVLDAYVCVCARVQGGGSGEMWGKCGMCGPRKWGRRCGGLLLGACTERVREDGEKVTVWEGERARRECVFVFTSSTCLSC